MGNAGLAIWWIGAIATCSYYWFTEGRDEEFVVGRTKGLIAFFFWYFFLVYLYVTRTQAGTRQVAAAKKRIVG